MGVHQNFIHLRAYRISPGMHLSGIGLDHLRDILSGAIIDHWTALFDDTRFFSCNLGTGVTQILGVLQTDGSDHRDQRMLDYIGGIKPSAKPGLQYHIFHIRFVENVDTHKEQKFKKGRVCKGIRLFLQKSMDHIHHCLKGFQEQFIGYIFLINLEPLIDIHQMRGCKQPRLLSCRCQNG